MTLRLINGSSRLLMSVRARGSAGIAATSSPKCLLHTSGWLDLPIQLKMPALSPTMTEGTIVKWHKKEGDKIVPGDMLFEVQTDKAVMSYEIEEEGVMAKILADAGNDSKPISVGSLVGIMVMPGEDWQNVAVPQESQTPAAASAAATTSSSQTQPQQTPNETTEHHYDLHNLRMGPAAKLMIAAYGIDPAKLNGSGPHGLVLKSDAAATASASAVKPQQQPSQPQSDTTAASKPSSTTPAALYKTAGTEVDFEDIELSNMRKVIAKRLLFSKTTIPHSYANINCTVDKIVELRKEMIKQNQKVSLNDFIVKAVAMALNLVPELNSNSQANSDSFVRLQSADISIAVATDKGLITPIVKNADRRSVLSISENVKTLADRARQGKLLPHEFQGGSFSISNLGMFGVSEFAAVINPPQVGILAVGALRSVLDEHMQARTRIACTLSFDERCVSMDRAMRFLSAIDYFIANPALLTEPTQF